MNARISIGGINCLTQRAVSCIAYSVVMIVIGIDDKTRSLSHRYNPVAKTDRQHLPETE